MERIEIVTGDIVTIEADAIVNAANARLTGGGGVDGAIHLAAGPKLMDACAKIGGCATGDAVITPGFNLPARYVIHAVGPIWQGGEQDEAKQLRSCYRRCMEIAEEHGVKTISFPAISCGAYGYPLEDAARIAVSAVKAFLAGDDAIEHVRFVCFEPGVAEVFEEALAMTGG